MNTRTQEIRRSASYCPPPRPRARVWTARGVRRCYWLTPPLGNVYILYLKFVLINVTERLQNGGTTNSSTLQMWSIKPACIPEREIYHRLCPQFTLPRGGAATANAGIFQARLKRVLKDGKLGRSRGNIRQGLKPPVDLRDYVRAEARTLQEYECVYLRAELVPFKTRTYHQPGAKLQHGSQFTSSSNPHIARDRAVDPSPWNLRRFVRTRGS